MNFSFCQIIDKTYYVVDKGMYIEYPNKGKKIKVSYKEKEEFYFSLKNDTTALIQEIWKGKFKAPKEYRISPNYDTAYVKRYLTVNGKNKLDVEKIIFQKVY